MINGSHFTSVILSGYMDVGQMRYFYFSVLTLIFMIIIFTNVLLIGVIYVERTLHEPMYLFLCSLSVNELYGSIGLFPALLLNILSDTHEVPLQFCYSQIFCLYTYVSAEYCNLAVMSFDRYMSICHPLHYHCVMTHCRVCILILVTWLFSFLHCSFTVYISARLQLCGNVIEKIWCDNYLLVRLACSNISDNNIYGVTVIILSLAVPFLLISYSYMKILQICWNSTTERKQKALSTCAPHIASVLNFSFGCLFEGVQSRFDNVKMPAVLRIFISVYFIICQTLFSPIMYGIGMSKVRKVCKKIFLLNVVH